MMGARLSSSSKSIKSQSQQQQQPKETKKYPLPIESLMLQQIKKDYHASKETSKPANNNDLCENEEKCNSNECRGDHATHLSNLASMSEEQYIMLERIVERLELSKNDDKNAGFSSYQKEGQTKCPFSIADLPVLVVWRLLDYLNPSAILTLRAVCKATKAWIDENDHILRDFEMRIEPELCKYNYEPPSMSPWSNFAIPFVHIDSDFVQDTMDNYADIIWSLELYAPKTFCSASTYPSNHPRRLFEIVGRCHQLNRLKVCRLDTLTLLPEDKQCFQCLRVLAIDRIQWMNHSDFSLFQDLVMACPLLEYLKIPEFEILGSLAFIFFDQNASPEKEHLIRPVLRYLDHYRSSSKIDGDVVRKRRHQSKLYIDVVEFEDFKLCSSEIFYELSRKCIDCNAVLMNVYFVPRDAVLRDEQNIVESFASMFGFIKIDFCAELWKNLEVMECWIEDFPNDLNLTIRQFEFLKTVAKIQTLRSLTIRMSVDDPDVCSGALQACVGQNYQGIRKLILRRHQIAGDTFVRIPVGFGEAFANVRFLYFQELDSPNEDFVGLWPSLRNLEELFVYKCPHLTQEAFIGKDTEQVPILKMTKLQILVIFLYDGIGGFNDDFLVKGLRFMKLKGFALRGAAGVEFTDQGMLSLLNSPFHDTIEDFEAPSSCFRPTLSSNYWSFYIALPRKELRRNRIWLSCSVLLSSLSSRKHPYDFQKKCLGI